MNDPTGPELSDEDAPPVPEAAGDGHNGGSSVLGEAYGASSPNARWLTIERASAVLRAPRERLEDLPPFVEPTPHGEGPG